MATKLGIDAEYIGTDYAVTRPRSRITEEDIEIIASDQASVYQSIIGKDLEGNSLSGAPVHVHDGTNGALLPHPLSYVHTRAGMTVVPAADTETESPALYPDQMSTSYPQRVLYHWPVFAPAGCTAARVYVRGNENLIGMYPTLHVDSTVGQWDTAYALDFDDPANPRVFFYDIALTGGAVNYLTFMLNQPWSASGTARVYQIDVCPQVWRKVPTEEPDPTASTVSGQVTGQVHTSTFLPIYDTYTKDGKPLSSAITGPLAANNALIHELLTDTPAYGYSAGHGAQVNGHWHDGAATGSSVIDVPLLSVCYGSAVVAAAEINGLTSGEADNDSGPLFNDPAMTSYSTIVHAVIAVPDKDSATSWTANWTATIYDDNGCDPQLTMFSGATPNATTNTNEPAATAGGWSAVSGTITVGDSGLYYLHIDGKITDNKSGTLATLTGLCVYLT